MDLVHYTRKRSSLDDGDKGAHQAVTIGIKL